MAIRLTLTVLLLWGTMGPSLCRGFCAQKARSQHAAAVQPDAPPPCHGTVPAAPGSADEGASCPCPDLDLASSDRVPGPSDDAPVLASAPVSLPIRPLRLSAPPRVGPGRVGLHSPFPRENPPLLS
ncbi:MAG: hypothetical protein ACE5FG_14520 [Myxococcota bacterium]